MLATHQKPGAFKRTDNLIPNARGFLVTRPGAVQILDGVISRAVSVGGRIVAVRNGRIVIADNATVHDLIGAGSTLDATAFQALTANAEREERIYIADGLRPLWYAVKENGAWTRKIIVNTVTDASGQPYPLENASVVCAWRSRLWFGYGNNRLRHCNNDAPEQWDPLWTQEMQGAHAGVVVAAEPGPGGLMVGTHAGLWMINGDSQYNFRPDILTEDVQIAGPRALAVTLELRAWATRANLFFQGAAISDDLSDLFESRPFGTELRFDTNLQILLASIAGRLVVTHISRPGVWGEIVTEHAINGVIALHECAGWYGNDGVWLLSHEGYPDRDSVNVQLDVSSVLETWQEMPNPNGRAHCGRIRFVFNDPCNATVTYTSETSEGATYTESRVFSGAAGLFDVDINPRLTGTSFTHRLTSDDHLEIHQYKPFYHFGVEDN